MSDATELQIRTSDAAWFAALAGAYKHRTRAVLIDDAHIGIDLVAQTLLGVGLKAKLGINDWSAALVALGMAFAGAVIVAAAVIDPEPTSKLSLMVGGGIACIFGGGFMAIQILTGRKPPSITVGSDKIHIGWD